METTRPPAFLYVIFRGDGTIDAYRQRQGALLAAKQGEKVYTYDFSAPIVRGTHGK